MSLLHLGLCFSVLRPVLHAHHAIIDGDIHAARRWLSFFVCATCFVLPWVLLLPSWWPLRYEGALTTLLLLSAADGAEATHRRWVTHMLAPVDRLVRNVAETTAEEVFEVATSAFESHVQARAPPPAPDEAETDDSTNGSDTADNPVTTQ